MVIDIQCQKPRPLAGELAIRAIGSLFLLTTVFILAAAHAPVWGWAVGLSAAIILVYMAGERFLRWAIGRLISRHLELATKSNFEAFVKKIAAWLPLDSSPRVMHAFLRPLLDAQLSGYVLRTWWNNSPPAVEPLRAPFEPRILDETDDAFLALESAARDEGDLPAPSLNPNTETDTPMIVRRIRRRRWGIGRWIAIVLVFINLLFTALISYSDGRLSWMVPISVVALGLLLFPLGGGGRSLHGQWLLVPGGVVLRKAQGTRSSVTLLERRRSLLYIRQFPRGKWMAYIANARRVSNLVVTDREMSLLVSTWLSPLAPPPVEKLVDLT